MVQRFREWINRHKKWILTALIAAFMLTLVAFMAYQFYSTGQRFAALGFLALGGAGVALCGVLFFLGAFKKIAKEKLFLVILVPLLLTYMCLFPPMTVPDEPAHYLSAYKISNYILLRTEQFGQKNTVLRQEDADVLHMTSHVDEESFSAVLNDFHVFSRADEPVEVTRNTAIQNAPAGYAFTGVALAIGRVLHLSGVVLFYWGRLMNMAVFALAVFWAIKKTPVGKVAFMAIALLPMTLHVAASYSYDGVVLAITMMFMAQFLSFLYGSEPATRADKIRLFVLGALLATSKMVYAPLLLIVFLIPAERLGLSRGKSILFKCGVVACGAAAVMALQFASFSGAVSADAAAQTHYPLSYFFLHPRNSIAIFIRTLLTKSDFYASTLVGSSLGWLEYCAPMVTYLPFMFILFCAFMRREGEAARTRVSQKLWILLLTFASAFLVMLSMFVFWTPFGSPVIEGVQGRYFLPLLPCVYLLARCRFFAAGETSDRYLLLAIPVCHVVLLLTVFSSVAGYWLA